LKRNERQNALERARKHIFPTGINDAASKLTVLNMTFGLARFHYIQNLLGFSPNATFIGAPDITITRNKIRWENGIGYGGKLSWGDNKDSVVFLEVLPNACGILVGGLQELPSQFELAQRILDLSDSPPELDGIEITWDFAQGNHYINLYQLGVASTEGLEDSELPPYVFVMHGSAPELRGVTQRGPGLYYHHSTILKDNCQIFETPFGKSYVLLDSEAREFIHFNDYAMDFSKKRRELGASLILEDIEWKILSNVNHQGLVRSNDMLLGTHDTALDQTLLPVGLRADLPYYLLRGKQNFEQDIIDSLGFYERAESLGVLSRLENANLCPHGGGYSFPRLEGIPQVEELAKGKRIYIAEMSSGRGKEVFSFPMDLESSYRGREVLVRTIELGMGEIAARLTPKFVIKM
jgi:hypothetical protein